MASRRAKSAMTRTRWTLVVASHALCASTAGLTLVAGRTQAARVKDLVRVAEIGSHKVIGYGLVVGLEGTGDGRRVSFTAQAVANMLEQFGLTVEPADLRLQNVAAVAVTAEVPPFARVGSTLDVLVSSIGDADSLQGGTLLMTPLRGLDDHVYVIAQGPVSLGGFAAARGGERSQKNHVAVGRAIGAGSVVRPIPQEGVAPAPGVCLSLLDPDFTTATRIAQAIEAELGAGTAKAADPATVLVNCPIADGRDLAVVMARIENIRVKPDVPAKVVINERTGTVVIGADVRLRPAAISHGALKVEIRTAPVISQPPPLSGGTTEVVTHETVRAAEEGGGLIAIPSAATVQQLVSALNALGATPRDLIAILQALREAGALEARLEIM